MPSLKEEAGGRNDVGVAINRHMKYLCNDENILNLDCVNVNIQVVILYIILYIVLGDVVIGRNWIKGTWDFWIMSYNK